MAFINAKIPRELVEELEFRFPQRCILPMEEMSSAHRYAGKVDLVAFIRNSYEDQRRQGPIEPITTLPIDKNKRQKKGGDP